MEGYNHAVPLLAEAWFTHAYLGHESCYQAAKQHGPCLCVAEEASGRLQHDVVHITCVSVLAHTAEFHAQYSSH